MRRLNGTLGALAALVLSAPIAATAQIPTGAIDPPGSDRAGKLLGADAPPAEPTPAAGTRYAGERSAPGLTLPPGARLSADAADAAATRANAAAAPGVVPPPVIGSHQIDRYDAIDKVQKAVENNPKSLADWIILGELAHEVAMDSPADSAGRYFTMSRDAFQTALTLAPNNAGLKAAVQFAKDQEKHSEQFEKSRDRFTDLYLNARRRDLAATGNIPYVKMYEPPLPTRTLPGPAVATVAPARSAALTTPAAPPVVAGAPVGAAPGDAATPAIPLAKTAVPPATPAAAAARVRATGDKAVDAAVPLVRTTDTPVAEAAPAVTPALTNAPATDAANYGTQQNYTASRSLAAQPMYYAGPRYRPFATVGGSPYTYDQYSTNFFPGVFNADPAVQPVTSQRYSTVVTPNAFEQRLINRAATGTPVPPGTGTPPGTVVVPAAPLP